MVVTLALQCQHGQRPSKGRAQTWGREVQGVSRWLAAILPTRLCPPGALSCTELLILGHFQHLLLLVRC